MRLMKLNLDGILEPMIALPIEKNNNLYYNIFHGDPKCWEFRCSVDHRLAGVKKEKTLIFKEDHFIIRNIKDDQGNIIKDIKGNNYCVISKDSNDIHKLDILLFWFIDPTLKNVVCSTKGFSKIIGNGYICNKDYTTPAPVIELYGNCKIEYTGIDINDKQVSVTYEYKHDQAILKRI